MKVCKDIGSLQRLLGESTKAARAGVKVTKDKNTCNRTIALRSDSQACSNVMNWVVNGF